MRLKNRFNTLLLPLALVFGFCCAPSPSFAGDLPAVSDGDHLWLIQQATPPEDDKDAEPSLKLYHLPTDTETYLANKLDPIKGQLMPRGVAAGDGRLLMVTDDRQLITIRATWSELLRNHVYQQRTLTALPEGCTLLALTMGDRGPWALVQVQSRELLRQLDERKEKKAGPTDQQILNRALGLPEDLQWDDRVSPQQTDEQPDAEGDVETPADDFAEEGEEQEAQQPKLPAYRLIHLRSSKWVSSPLPEEFDVPRQAQLLIRSGDDRPTVLVDRSDDFRRSPRLVRYNPVEPVERPIAGEAAEDEQGDNVDIASPGEALKWDRLLTGMQLRPGRQWSATLVNDQIIVGLERYRPRENVQIDTFRLHGDDAYEIGYAYISTGEGARWALFPWENEIGMLASPAPLPDPSKDQANRLPTLALFAGLSIEGQPKFQNDEGQGLLMPIAEKKPSAFEGNADLIIQILAFITAMFMMVMFYRRAPQQSQVDLPDHLVLASFSRRAIAGVIDLAPGFFLAGLIYNVTIGEIVLESWPGNGIEKAFAAMRPGFVVIFVTLLHTTVCEFILARSLGKIMMGMYVADLNGKPAPPMPCLGRALSRAFELFAPLMILVAVISPARQRLGDILAKTTVVMRKPEPFIPPDDDDV
jgi:uncharacterized RDD family membrane protein YckC